MAIKSGFARQDRVRQVDDCPLANAASASAESCRSCALNLAHCFVDAALKRREPLTLFA